MKLFCGYRCVQIILLLLNLIVLVCGISLVIVGSLAQNSIFKYHAGVDDTIRYITITTIVLGCLLIILGFLGVYGSCTRNAFVLVVYAACLSVLVVVECISGILAAAYRTQLFDYLIKSLKVAVKSYGKNPNIKIIIDKMQQQLYCCGASSPSDYTSSGQTIPDSCRKHGLYFTEGCSEKLMQIEHTYTIAMIVMVFTFAILHALAITFAVCLAIDLTRNEDDEEFYSFYN